MKRHMSFPFMALAGLILLVGIACMTTTVTPTAIPPVQPTQPAAPTQAVLPTQPPLPTQVPTNPPPPTAAPSKYFTEDFLQDPGPNWSLILKGPGKDKVDQLKTSYNNGVMRFEINANDIYAYYFYTPNTYSDVRLDLRVENKGVNSQNIGLVCRSSGDTWYEFSVGSDGLWYLYAYKNGDYDTLAMAGAASLKQGHATNDYAMSCIGDKIHMYVNGTELPYSPFKPLNYFYSEGTVGFNISSISVTPVIADVDFFKISQP